jgi:ABC-type branched-subunit amino acid transport system substrate-binding protein
MQIEMAIRWCLAGFFLLALTACTGFTGSSPDSAVSGPVTTGQISPAVPAAPPGTVKVALLLPLTGSPNAQQVAKALKQAGEMALFDFNNPNVQLSPKDTHGTPDGARAAAREAVAEGAELIIGPLFAAEVSAAAPEAQRASIPMIAFSSDQKVAGNGVFLLSFLPGSDVPRIVSYAASQNKKRFAALLPQNEYGRLVEQTFTRAVQESGGRVVSVQHYPPDANGMMEPVKKLAEISKKGKAAMVDAIFLPAGSDTLPSLAALLPYYEIDTASVKMLGSSGWDYPGAGKEPALLGGWYPASDPKGWQDFSKRYAETYGDAPPRLASLSYDAVSLAISLSSSQAGRRFTQAELTRASGFAGVDGLFRLKPDGTAERGFAVLELQRFGPRVAEPAPPAFASSSQY